MHIQLAIIAILAAMLPLALTWMSSDADKYRKLVWITLFLTCDLVMFGAFTRLTDSGLGCPDWPGCYGHANPFQAHASISAAEAAMPTGPVTVAKAWIEMIHRYLAMGIGVLIIVLAIGAWRMWLVRRTRRFSPWLPSMLLGFVCLQGAFGAWTVTMKLQPIIVTMHLLLGMALLAMLTWLAARQSEHAKVAPEALALRSTALAATAVFAVQLALGGWVSTNYAALACLDYPLCHGEFFPQMDFQNGFTLWRDLGKTSDGDFLPFPALTAIHWIHRGFAIVVILMLGWLTHQTIKIDGLRKTSFWIRMVLALQFITGVSTIFLKWPLALAVVHNGGAAFLVVLLAMLNYKAGLPAICASRNVSRHQAGI